MAYIKYKELTKYFNFSEELSPEIINEEKFYYLRDYLDKDEKVYAVYKTKHDKALFTDKRMILFDVFWFLGLTKKIHIIPYDSISSSAVVFNTTTGAILLSLNSGYQMRLNFVRLKGPDKTRLRKLYSYIMNKKK